MINWSRSTSCGYSTREKRRRCEKKWHDYPKFIGPLHELAKPRIRNIRAELFRLRDSFSTSYPSSSCERTGRVCSVWSRMLPEDYETPEWRSGSPPSSFLFPFCCSCPLHRSVPFADYAGIVSSEGLTLAHLETTRVPTNEIANRGRGFMKNLNETNRIGFRLLSRQRNLI